MALAEGITAAKAAFEVSKIVLDLYRYPKTDAHEVHARLLELQGLILSAQLALAEGLEENRRLHTAIDELKRTADFGKDFKFEEGVYWHRDYPYCPNCWDIDRKPVRLDGPTGLTNSDWSCPIHRSKYYLKKYYQPASF